MRTARVAVPTAVLLLSALAGCGGEEDAPASTLSDDEQTAADNLAAQIVRSESMAEEPGADAVTDAQAECIAEGAVTDVGLASLQDYGIVTEDLRVNKSIQGVEMDGEDADALAGVFIECIDAEALFEERFLAGLPSGKGAKQRRTCVEEAVDAETVEKILSSSFQGERPRAYTDLDERVSACGRSAGRGQ